MRLIIACMSPHGHFHPAFSAAVAQREGGIDLVSVASSLSSRPTFRQVDQLSSFFHHLSSTYTIPQWMIMIEFRKQHTKELTGTVRSVLGTSVGHAWMHLDAHRLSVQAPRIRANTSSGPRAKERAFHRRPRSHRTRSQSRTPGKRWEARKEPQALCMPRHPIRSCRPLRSHIGSHQSESSVHSSRADRQ